MTMTQAQRARQNTRHTKTGRYKEYSHPDQGGQVLGGWSLGEVVRFDLGRGVEQAQVFDVQGQLYTLSDENGQLWQIQAGRIVAGPETLAARRRFFEAVVTGNLCLFQQTDAIPVLGVAAHARLAQDGLFDAPETIGVLDHLGNLHIKGCRKAAPVKPHPVQTTIDQATGFLERATKTGFRGICGCISQGLG